MSTIAFINGTFRERKGEETDVAGHSFELAGKWSEYADGTGFYPVKGSTVEPTLDLPTRTIRIRCNSPADAVIDNSPVQADAVPFVSLRAEQVAKETDAEIIERLRGRFKILEDMTQAVKSGVVRGMIVAGPPGVGKSFGVDEVLARQNLFNQVGSFRDNYEVVKGAMSALGLYRKLYDRRDKGDIVIFDDCDSILLDDLSLNILKAALDSSKKRRISWNTDSHVLRREGIPDSFLFNAGVIFITNVNFDNVRSKKIRDHLAALESRCHFIDLEMDTDREKILRIKQIIQDGMLTTYNFEHGEVDEIVGFIEQHMSSMRELSLRSVLKLADLRKAMPATWNNVARLTVLKGVG